MTAPSPDDSLIDRRFVRLDEGLIHLRQAGGDNAPKTPVMLLHASPASSRTLEPLLAALAQTGPAFAPDTPGNGLSAAPRIAEPTLPDYADMLNRLCDQLGLDTIDLYGTHTGAHIALELAIMAPDRVRGLIINGLACLTEEERTDFLAHYAPPQRPDATGLQFHWAWNFIRDQMIFFPHFRKDTDHLRPGGTFDPRVLHDLTMDVLTCLDTYHQAYEAVFQHRLEERLGLVPCPTLVVDSGHSYLQAGLDMATRLIPDHTLARVSEAPEPLAAAIRDFQATLPTRG